MKTIEINVEEKDILSPKSMLKKLDYITIIKEGDKEEDDWVSFASELSLTEEWENDEDRRYENFINQ